MSVGRGSPMDEEAPDHLPMNTSWIYPVCPFAALTFMVIVQGVLMRVARRKTFYHSVIAGFLAGLVVLVVLQVALAHHLGELRARCVLLVAVNPAVYLGLAYAFFNFINLGQSSIRIRVFRECQHRSGFITHDELRAIYNEDAIRDDRLERLKRGGHIALEKGRWRMANFRLVPVAVAVAAIKLLVLGRTNQFDPPERP